MGTQRLLPQKGAQHPPLFGPCQLWPNGWMKMPFGREVGLSPGDSVRWDPPPKGDTAPPLFSPCLLWPNGWMDQDVTWFRGRPQPRPHCVRWRLSSPPPERGTAAPPFASHVYHDETTVYIKMPLGTEVGLGPGDIALDRNPALPKGNSP